MAEYYEGMGRRSGPRKRTVAGILFGGAMALFSALAAAVTVLTFAAPYVNPASCWIFSILGLAAPVIYLLTVLLALYWIVRWRWGWASVMLVLVVVGLFKVSLFYKPEFRRVYDDTPVNGRGTVRFMTYNVRNFYSDDGRSSVAEILRMVEETDPDIVCMQEFNPALAEETAEYRTFLENYPYSVGGAAEDPRTAPLAIFSKFRTIRWGMAHPELQNENARESIWADLRIGDDTVRVFNNHLHSTAINASDNEFITKHRYISDTAREDKIRSIVRRFRDNSILRARQVDSIAREIGATPHARIVCGDFNDTPMSYVYRRMAAGLQDAFRESGMGYSFTFRGFFNTLRIDYVLVSEAFEPLAYAVPEVDYSDHRPVVVQLRHVPSH